jgi:VCBS repeat-containing protein
LDAGTATAATAPLKFTSGTNLTTPEAGAVEFDGTNYFATSSTTRYTLAKTLTNTATLDFTSTSAGTSNDLTITVTGASDGDVVYVGAPNASVNANTSFSAWVSTSNTVTVRFNNYSSGAVDPASGTFRVSVIKY